MDREEKEEEAPGFGRGRKGHPKRPGQRSRRKKPGAEEASRGAAPGTKE